MQLYIDSVHASLEFRYGTVRLADGAAIIDVPEGYKYLDPDQSSYVLSVLWNNPPSPTLGMLFPEDMMPLQDKFTYAIEINYEQLGFVDDEGANSIDYDDLLEQMQEEFEQDNGSRKANGYLQAHLVGWAIEPRYDAQQKKLYWAKEIAIEGEKENILNYDVRILGRDGFLSLNVISTMDKLSLVKQRIGSVINNAGFSEDKAYDRFDPSKDREADHGIEALITGNTHTPMGLLDQIPGWWKYVLLGLLIAGWVFRKQILATIKGGRVT